MTDAEILAELTPITSVDPRCVVPTTLRVRGEDVPDDSEVVRHAAPLDDRARAQLREQAIARMRRDPEAVAARERRIAIARGRVSELRRRA